MINRRHVGLRMSDLGAKNRAAILEATKMLAARGELPTMLALCKMTGIFSTSTIAGHLEALAQRGDLMRYTHKRGTTYLPVCECARDTIAE